MKITAQVLFWFGVLCFPLAWTAWYVGPELEVGRQVMSHIADPALRAVLQEAHAERLGLWISVWPVTLFVLSYILDRKSEGSIG